MDWEWVALRDVIAQREVHEQKDTVCKRT